MFLITIGGPKSIYLQDFSGFLKHSFLSLTVTTTAMTVDYYEADFDCWSHSNPANWFNGLGGTCKYYTPTKAWTETF